MLERETWQDLARNLDWEFSYVEGSAVYPESIAGKSHVPEKAWQSWEEPFKTSFFEYVILQHKKNQSVHAVRESLGKSTNFQNLSLQWLNGLKLYSATFPLAEYAAVIGNLRAARFAPVSAWRSTALLGALDELRHTQIPLAIMHELVRWDGQFDWTHKLFHTNNWISIAARHLVDELLLLANPIEFAIATNFVFETGFTNLQFVGLSALAELVGDHLYSKMLQSIQTDETRHAQIGPATLRILIQHDKQMVQFLIDKWFWRTWHLFAIVTGFSIDYFSPLEKRQFSFREFIDEWVTGQFLSMLDEYGLEKPWYWDQFIHSVDYYHHMIFASAYTYRATTWFNWHIPSPREREWLQNKYRNSWPSVDKVWQQIITSQENSSPGVEWSTHGTTPIGFCSLCQFALCHGTPEKNIALTKLINGKSLIFCSEPCAWIYEKNIEYYHQHKDIVQRILTGEAPGNVLALVEDYFGLTQSTWGKDGYAGVYPWASQK